MTATTTRPCAHEESRAISLLTDDQAMASFIRWRTGQRDTIALPSLHVIPSIRAYVDVMFTREAK